jgi:hypothetical protein
MPQRWQGRQPEPLQAALHRVLVRASRPPAARSLLQPAAAVRQACPAPPLPRPPGLRPCPCAASPYSSTAPALRPLSSLQAAARTNRSAAARNAMNRTATVIFLREIQSPRCIPAVSKVWNGIPSSSSFICPASRDLPCPNRWEFELQYPPVTIAACFKLFADWSLDDSVITVKIPVSCKFRRKPPGSIASFQSSPTMEFFRSNPNLFLFCKHYFLCLAILCC